MLCHYKVNPAGPWLWQRGWCTTAGQDQRRERPQQEGRGYVRRLQFRFRRLVGLYGHSSFSMKFLKSIPRRSFSIPPPFTFSLLSFLLSLSRPPVHWCGPNKIANPKFEAQIWKKKKTWLVVDIDEEAAAPKPKKKAAPKLKAAPKPKAPPKKKKADSEDDE